MPNTEYGMLNNTNTQCYISPLFCILTYLFTCLSSQTAVWHIYISYTSTHVTPVTQSILAVVFVGQRSVFESQGLLSAHFSIWHYLTSVVLFTKYSYLIRIIYAQLTIVIHSKKKNCFICPIDWTLTGTIILDQNRLKGNCKERIFHILRPLTL